MSLYYLCVTIFYSFVNPKRLAKIAPPYLKQEMKMVEFTFHFENKVADL
jgi:hypothetical protein